MHSISIPCFSIARGSFLLVILMIGMVMVGYGQQDPAYSHFMYNGLAVNPAVAGSAETFSATGIVRKQWSGIQGAPETQTLNVDAPVWNRRLGLGISVINDKVGVVQNLTVNAQYAYRILFEKSTLSLGLQGGMSNYKADYTSVVTNSQSASDNAFSENTNRMIFNVGSGIYYYSERFFAGFSVPHLINQRLDGIRDTDGVQSRQYRHYFVTAGYVFDAGEKFKIKPSALLKVADGAPLQVDANASIWYNETFSLGFSYRTNDSFTTMVQIQIAKQFRIGYAYDFIISSLSRYTSGNNEVMLRYELRKEKTRILTPRFF